MLQTSRISAGVTPRASAARTSLVKVARSMWVMLALTAIEISATTRGLSTPDTRAAPAHLRNTVKNSGSDRIAAAAPSSHVPKTVSYSARNCWNRSAPHGLIAVEPDAAQQGEHRNQFTRGSPGPEGIAAVRANADRMDMADRRGRRDVHELARLGVERAVLPRVGRYVGVRRHDLRGKLQDQLPVIGPVPAAPHELRSYFALSVAQLLGTAIRRIDHALVRVNVGHRRLASLSGLAGWPPHPFLWGRHWGS